MTDEGQHGDPVNEVEMENAMRNVAHMARTLYDQLREEKFSESEALALTGQWLRAAASGSSA